MNDPFDQDHYDEDPYGKPPEPEDPVPADPPPAPPTGHPADPPTSPEGYAQTTHSQGLRCHNCNADLSGAMLGGSCPACGAPITANYYGSQQTNGMAVSSMILGIVSAASALPAFCCGCLWGISGICGILAIIFYFPAMSAVNQESTPSNAKGMALTGLICGIAGILISLVSFGLMILLSL